MAVLDSTLQHRQSPAAQSLHLGSYLYCPVMAVAVTSRWTASYGSYLSSYKQLLRQYWQPRQVYDSTQQYRQ